MNDIKYGLECAAYEEKIMLADLEVKKAEERSAELAFEYARFRMQWLQAKARAFEQQAAKDASGK